MTADVASSSSSSPSPSAQWSVQVQKKLAGSLAGRNVAKMFIDDTTTHLMDTLYHVLKPVYDKKQAEKTIKNMIKLCIKVGVLSRNGSFNASQQQLLAQVERRLRQLLMTVVSFAEVDFSYSHAFLKQQADLLQTQLEELCRPHLSDKSTTRIRQVFSHLADARFTDALFAADGAHGGALQLMVADIKLLLEPRQHKH